MKGKTMLDETIGPVTKVQPGASSTVQMDAATGALHSPFCTELRSKKYFFLQEIPTEEHHLLDATRHCWCRKTMQAAGPDGERVQPADCRPGRPGYVSYFAE